MDPTLTEVIDKLVERTKAGKVRWEDVSGPSAERFRVDVEDVTIEILSGQRRYDGDEDHILVDYCRLQVFDEQGLVVAEEYQEAGEPEWRRLSGVVDVARTSARRRGPVLRKLLTTLSE